MFWVFALELFLKGGSPQIDEPRIAIVGLIQRKTRDSSALPYEIDATRIISDLHFLHGTATEIVSRLPNGIDERNRIPKGIVQCAPLERASITEHYGDPCDFLSGFAQAHLCGFTDVHHRLPLVKKVCFPMRKSLENQFLC